MPHTALIVHDDADLARHTAEAFRNEGYFVSNATSFEEARARLKFVAPDLLITPRRLKRFNGLQLVILGRSVWPEMVAIVTDPDRDEGGARDAADAGALYVSHSVDPGMLVEFARQLFQGRPARSLTMVPRKWTRKPVQRAVQARVGEVKVNVLDVSYGGLRVEVADGDQEDVMSGRALEMRHHELSLPVHAVWARRALPASAWWCGVELRNADAATLSRWHAFVDEAR